MADERIALKQLLDKGSDAELLSEMIGLVANRLMQLDVESLCKASRYERNDERENYRNGYRDPYVGDAGGHGGFEGPEAAARRSYFPEFLGPRRASEQALVAVIQEAYIGGSVDARRGQPGEDDGDEWRVEEPGLAAVRVDRRACG